MRSSSTTIAQILSSHPTLTDPYMDMVIPTDALNRQQDQIAREEALAKLAAENANKEDKQSAENATREEKIASDDYSPYPYADMAIPDDEELIKQGRLEIKKALDTKFKRGL